MPIYEKDGKRYVDMSRLQELIPMLPTEEGNKRRREMAGKGMTVKLVNDSKKK